MSQVSTYIPIFLINKRCEFWYSFMHIDILMTSEEEFSNISSLVFNHLVMQESGFLFFKKKGNSFLAFLNKQIFLTFSTYGFKVSFLVNQKIEEIVWFYNFFFHFPKFLFLIILEYELCIFFFFSFSVCPAIFFFFQTTHMLPKLSFSYSKFGISKHQEVCYKFIQRFIEIIFLNSLIYILSIP